MDSEICDYRGDACCYATHPVRQLARVLIPDHEYDSRLGHSQVYRKRFRITAVYVMQNVAAEDVVKHT